MLRMILPPAAVARFATHFGTISQIHTSLDHDRDGQRQRHTEPAAYPVFTHPFQVGLHGQVGSTTYDISLPFPLPDSWNVKCWPFGLDGDNCELLLARGFISGLIKQRLTSAFFKKYRVLPKCQWFK